MIHRIRINKVNPDLSKEQVLVIRVADQNQMNAEALGERLRTRWMELNPGVPTEMALDWPTSEEQGGRHVWPARH